METMSSNFANQAPFLRTSRNFPEDPQALTVEVNKSYIDIANAVNNRTISLFVQGRPVITGESWFLSSSRQQTIRQIYSITGAGSYPHMLNLSQIFAFSRIFGSFTDGTNWYPLPYVSATAANNQVQLSVTLTNIVITAGAGSPPTISSGVVVLEWISQV